MSTAVLVEFSIWVCAFLSLICVSLEFDPSDNYLIDCGSQKNTSIGDRVFVSDSFYSSLVSTTQQVFVNTTSNSNSNVYSSTLYQTAVVLLGTSNYTFSVEQPGRHWIRLYFFPFADLSYNLSEAEFSVSAQSFTLLRSSQLGNGPSMKEYSLNITSNRLVLTFAPSVNSFAYLNALEVVSVPDVLIPHSAPYVDPQGSNRDVARQALETVYRVNMGNETVHPQNDTLSRHWVPDESFLRHHNFVKFVSKVDAVNYTSIGPTPEFAPDHVYGTVSKLNSASDPNTKANVTWLFNVDPGFDYLVRFHFCDIISSSIGQMIFNVYINSRAAASQLDLSNQTSDVLAAPYSFDVVTKASGNNQLNVSIGPSGVDTVYPNAILNGLEIMKINSSKSSLDASDSDIPAGVNSKVKVGLIVGLATGVLFMLLVVSIILFFVCRRRIKLACTETSGGGNVMKGGYHFPLAVIREATDNFSESLVIGVGGFGKVYKGVFKDGTKAAVKRGAPESHQGLAEFRTEIELLSQFRHRHLVSLIGYCDEQNELIIIYEYMENGTLKNHLCGSDHPSLSWRQRLEICVGSARGLHYLHTGSTKAIIHRDVKSANILLDENFMAKVADFGLSKTGPDLDQTHVSTAVKGSFGYLDPEYLIRQQLTDKSDVYSFGVVLFEVLCGRPVIDPSLPRERVNLAEWALKSQRKGELENIVDPRLTGQIRPESLRKFGETAEKCLAECGLDRPTMGEVLWNLECVLQLQADKASSINDGTVCLQVDDARREETGASTTLCNMGSAAEFADLSMGGIFSQMKKAERS